jgi:hypothetical protein
MLARAVQAACAGQRTAVLRSPDLAHDANFHDMLAILPAPLAIVGVDLSEAGEAVLRRLAHLAGAAYFALGDAYPVLCAGRPRRLVRNLREHVSAIAAWLRPEAGRLTEDAPQVAVGSEAPLGDLCKVL